MKAFLSSDRRLASVRCDVNQLQIIINADGIPSHDCSLIADLYKIAGKQLSFVT